MKPEYKIRASIFSAIKFGVSDTKVEVIAAACRNLRQSVRHDGCHSSTVFRISKQDDVEHGKLRQAQYLPVTTSSTVSVAGAHHAVLLRLIRSPYVQVRNPHASFRRRIRNSARRA
jgi:hypothetical protein